MLIRIIAAVLLIAASARGQDLYFRIPLSDLTITQGSWPDESPDGRFISAADPRPYAMIDKGEAYIVTKFEESLGSAQRGTSFRWSRGDATLVVRAPGAASGTICIPAPGGYHLTSLQFTIPASAASADAAASFNTAKAIHYEALQLSGAPGTAWFRYQAAQARRALAQKPNSIAPAPAGSPLMDTYDLFSGGRALSENLQLYRQLAPVPETPAAPPDKLVLLSTIPGITIDAMKWEDALAGAMPGLDAMATAIPADQHAVFFSSTQALAISIESAGDEALPIFRSLARSADSQIRQRYERQLGFTLPTLTKALSAGGVRTIALTGSDPYFDTGTDIALIFECADAAALARRLAESRIATGEPAKGESDGIAYQGIVAPDRSVSSYIAVIGDAVVLTNSPFQLNRIAAVRAGKRPSLASLGEYRYFRNRYPLGAAGESALIVISDPTIRRWCGPEWRIAASRRLRASAILADVTAASADDLVAGVDKPRPARAETPMRTIGDLTLGPRGVRSSVYGTLEFLTPIAELGITEVTEDEAAAYNQWRNAYQNGWGWAFDPIAIRLNLSKERCSADLTVAPLIIRSQYRTWVTIAQGAAIAAGAGDPHDSVFHMAMAFNPESAAAQQLAAFAAMAAPNQDIEPFRWIGSSIALYADPSPFWDEMIAASRKNDDHFFDKLGDIPIALHAEVADSAKLTAFLAALQKLANDSQPGFLVWERKTYGQQEYFRVGQKEVPEHAGELDRLTVYYAAMPKALIVSLSEDVLKKTIDRQAAPPDPALAAKRPWLGQSLCLQLSEQGLKLVGEFLGGEAHVDSWSNIPILNEWKRRYPDKDPLAVHQLLWHTLPTCPAGGLYEWDAGRHTMFSTAFGSPLDSRTPESYHGPLTSLSAANFGITFEKQGLRARIDIDRPAAKMRR